MGMRRRVTKAQRSQAAARLVGPNTVARSPATSAAGPSAPSAFPLTPRKNRDTQALPYEPPTTPVRRTTAGGTLRGTSGTGLTPQSVKVQRTRAKRNSSPVRAFRSFGRGYQEQATSRALPTQIGFVLGVPPSDNSSSSEEEDGDWVDEPHNPVVSAQEDVEEDEIDAGKTARREAYRKKRLETTARWTKEVLPKLRGPYMRLLTETKNLRDPPRRKEPTKGVCTCGGKAILRLSVVVLRMSDVGRVDINSCHCRPAATQLVEVGLFPCAPYRPSLAIDINVLDFVRLLFLNISPNVTAWCKAMELFLIARSHKLQYSDNLRKRFGYALLWFTHLHNQVQVHVDNFIRQPELATAPAPLDNVDDDDDGDLSFGAPPSSPTPAGRPTASTRSPPSPASPSVGQRRKRRDDSDELLHNEGGAGEGDEAVILAEPTEYLRGRCAACFGSNRRLSASQTSAPDSIVALDACFSQKHNLQTRDPAFLHPASIMLDEATLDAAEKRVDAARGGRKPPRKRSGGARSAENHEEELVGIRVPADALRNCEESFTAAQESIAKANVGNHDVTAVMALICRHDIPLFWANMTTPGEKQYYAVALMDALMENLPDDWRVGVLYDIACQMHASAVRYGIFAKYLHRLQFAVSIFHAFGHDWPCQIIYHPRKCLGFGLTDGEGCERVWYSISRLIPYLRVAGYHLRLYTLNGQIAFATKEAGANMGAWLSRKARNLEGKRAEALRMIADSGEAGSDPAVVRAEWAAQVEEQTKPLPKQSKDLGQREVEKALHLLGERQEAEKAVDRLRTAAEGKDLGLEGQAELQLAEANLLAAKARYENKVAELGVVGQRQLRRLTKSQLLHVRANGLVLLRRAQVGIMKQKMEVERVVRSHRNKNGGSERRLHKHIKTAAERREGTVKTTVSKYNKLCRELAALIKKRGRRGPCTIRPLKELPPSGFWDLDIDNPCWDDLRFDAADSSQAPRWMADDNMRRAIRGQLLLDRCLEEQARLEHERKNVLDWYEHEWLAVQNAQRRGLRQPDAPALLHQLENRRRTLLRVAVHWHNNGLNVRGPSEGEFALALEEWAQASCDYDPAFGRATEALDEEDGPGIGGLVDDEVEEDGEMVEAVEGVLAERDRLEGEVAWLEESQAGDGGAAFEPQSNGGGTALSPIQEGGLEEEDGWYTE